MFLPPVDTSKTSRTGRRPYRGQFLLILLVTVVPLVVGWLGLAFLERRFIATSGEAVAVVAADIADSIDLFLVERYGDIQILADVVKIQAQKSLGKSRSSKRSSAPIPPIYGSVSPMRTDGLSMRWTLRPST